MNFPQRIRCNVPIALSALLACLHSGCRDQELKTGYGRAHGPEYSSSVNGTVEFQQMVEAQGYETDRYGRISPRWDRYQTAIWFPDGYATPDVAALARIEDWVAGGGSRTFVLVCRDYDGAIVYWDQMRAGSSEKDDTAAREYSEAVQRNLREWNFEPIEDSMWYQLDSNPWTRAKTVAGPLAEGTAATPDIWYGQLPTPGSAPFAKFKDYDCEVLLMADGLPLVYSLTKDEWQGGRIIVVGNASFMSNLGLTNRGNRQLANNLIADIGGAWPSPTEWLFIESGPEIEISESEEPLNRSRWSWITQRPLRYIVPNVLLWCLLFCFVYFPIFGRPRRIERSSTINFRDHIRALARLLGKTNQPEVPWQWIDEYRRRTHHGGTGSGIPKRRESP